MVSSGAMSVEEVELFINKFTTPTTVSIRLYHMLVQIVEAMVLLCVGLVVDMVMSAPHHLIDSLSITIEVQITLRSEVRI